MSKYDKLSTEEFKLKVAQKFDYIEVIGEYINNKTPILIKDKRTGNTKSIRPDNLFNVKRPFLTYNRKKPKEYLTESARQKIIEKKRSKNKKSNEEILEKINSNLYELVPEKTSYINNKKSTIYLRCKRCLLEFPISFVNICAGKGCPYCNKEARQESKNMALIKEFLELNNIDYETEYRFPECHNQRTLPFDIKVDINNKLKLIEYDGEFHDFGYNNNKEGLEKTKNNDKIKTLFCEKNNIPLLRLRYNNFKNYKNDLKDFLEIS